MRHHYARYLALIRRPSTALFVSFSRLGAPFGVALVLGCLLLGLWPGPDTAYALRGVKNYPRVLQVASQLGEYTEAELDSLSWYDVVMMQERPSVLQQVRDRNPDIEIFYHWLPQNFVSWSEDETFWHADTTWSVVRLCQFYAQQNDWYLRDTNGDRIEEWSGYAANWTRYCKKGVYGTSVGMTYPEWLVEVAIPQICLGGADWEPWGWDSDAYQGMMFEIFVDCVGSFGYDRYLLADPDQDGIPENVTAGCASGGDQDSLSILFTEINEWWGPRFYEIMGSDFPVIGQGANKYIQPSWNDRAVGHKLESWLSSPPHPTWQDWWDFFYELKDWGGVEPWEAGYVWAEQNLYCTGIDEIDGWDHSFIQVTIRGNWSEAETERRKRFGMGTSMLGDGFFSITRYQTKPWWQPEFDWDFGEARGDFFIETEVDPERSVTDSLYVRLFDKGFVEVNPNLRELIEIPAQDTRFGFWRTLTSLDAASVGGTTLEVSFVADDESAGPVDYHIRYATSPISPETWEAATPLPGGPLDPAPASTVAVEVPGLEPLTTYYFAARNEVYGRLEPGISNVATATTQNSTADETPPAAIGDVAPIEVDSTWVRLQWTAPGDDGSLGTATQYLVRYREGGTIANESMWASASVAPGSPPLPAVAGTTQEFIVAGLSPSTTYGFAVRALDDAGLMGGLSNLLGVTTADPPPPPPPPPPGDSTPPAAITDLAAVDTGTTWIDLSWTAPGDDGMSGQADVYEVRALLNSAISSEAHWDAAIPGGGVPSPGPAGTSETYRFDGLSPGKTYGIAVRATDLAGNVAPLSNALTADTQDDDPPPPPPPPPPPADPAPPLPIGDLEATPLDSVRVELRWTAPADTDGVVVSYDLGVFEGDSLDGAQRLGRPRTFERRACAGGTRHARGLRGHGAHPRDGVYVRGSVERR